MTDSLPLFIVVCVLVTIGIVVGLALAFSVPIINQSMDSVNTELENRSQWQPQVQTYGVFFHSALLLVAGAVAIIVMFFVVIWRKDREYPYTV